MVQVRQLENEQKVKLESAAVWGKEVAAADLNLLLMIKIDTVGVMQTEEVVEAVLVEVAEEMIERTLQRKGDLVAVVLVDRIKRTLNGGRCFGTDLAYWISSDFGNSVFRSEL
ncbi:hypothetical protein F511_19152 [Dorcoceras hygrometricum]|uniref:Uncharacterized protein n=1 Tax=Dorcoceras hygrometricum TaxID=472368 RepID=A0A2Z7BEQ3_9LAMI|nr:hypothetical protein F511_19152 [Dorcoceras hygrometricum]